MARDMKFKAPYCNNECKQNYGNTTNDGKFCEAGYKQNPATLEGIYNLIKNGGSVCSRARSFLQAEENKKNKAQRFVLPKK